MKLVELLKEGALQFDIELSSEQIEQFIAYKDLLIAWNKKVNLTAIKEENDIIIKHFVDSMTCLVRQEFFHGCTVIDIGTGAGFPGIPIKIARPDIKITLLDSLNKRVNFLNEIINQLHLSNIDTIHARAEDAGRNRDYREKYDLAVSRAVAHLSVLAEYALPLVKTGGHFVSMKGPDVSEEVEQAQNAIQLLNGEIVGIDKIHLSNTDIFHSLIMINKIKNCPTKYPRKAGKPVKVPLK